MALVVPYETCFYRHLGFPKRGTKALVLQLGNDHMPCLSNGHGFLQIRFHCSRNLEDARHSMDSLSPLSFPSGCSYCGLLPHVHGFIFPHFQQISLLSDDSQGNISPSGATHSLLSSFSSQSESLMSAFFLLMEAEGAQSSSQ